MENRFNDKEINDFIHSVKAGEEVLLDTAFKIQDKLRDVYNKTIIYEWITPTEVSVSIADVKFPNLKTPVGGYEFEGDIEYLLFESIFDAVEKFVDTENNYKF